MLLTEVGSAAEVTCGLKVANFILPCAPYFLGVKRQALKATLFVLEGINAYCNTVGITFAVFVCHDLC